MSQTIIHSPPTVRTTLSLTSDLVERSQQWVDKGVVANRNALFVAAIEQFLTQLEREEIDRQFALMAEDEAYQRLNEEVANQFALSDWEALTGIEQAGAK